MKKKLFPASMSLQEIRDNLDAECYRKEPLHPFFKPFSDQERQELEGKLVEKIKQIEGLNNELKPLKKDVKTISAELHTGGRGVVEDVYVFVDQDHDIAGIYNDRGELIEKRALTPDERQLTIE